MMSKGPFRLTPFVLAMGGVIGAGCAGSADTSTSSRPDGAAAASTSSIVSTTTISEASTITTTSTSTNTTKAPTTTPPTTTTPTTTPPTTTTPTTTTTSATLPTTTPYGLPVADAGSAGWGDTHSSYPATDIFVGCGADLVSPVNGTLLEVRRVNSYDPAVDNPATRGGRSVSILGDDGVRYYLAHFESIVEPLNPGDRAEIGQYLGAMGDTGRTSACHLHFSISPPCPGAEWSVRRGVIWPYPYLDAWRRGAQLSPVDEVRTWSAANPTACADAMSDPNAGDA